MDSPLFFFHTRKEAWEGWSVERDRLRMLRRQRLKSILSKLLVFLLVLGLAVLAFAVAGTTR